MMMIWIARLRAWRWYLAQRRAYRIYDRPGHAGAWDAQGHANDVFRSLPQYVQNRLAKKPDGPLAEWERELLAWQRQDAEREEA